MAKIPTYESRRTPTGQVVRPNLPDYTVDIAQGLVKASNKILDQKAIDEGFKQGKVEQQKALESGAGFVEQEGYTLRSQAFNKGSNAAYVAGMKTKAEQELSALATEINDPLSKVPITERVTTYNERKEEIKNDYFQSIPSHMQGDLGGYFDSLSFRYGEQVFANQRNLEVGEIKATIAGRVDTALETIPALIRDGGYNNNADLEEQFADIVAAIDEGLGSLSPATAFAYKEKIKTAMQVSSIQRAYKEADDKQAFIDDLAAGGEAYKKVMQDVNESFFDGDTVEELEASGPGGYKTLSKTLQQELNNEKVGMAVDRSIWENDFNQAMALYQNGVDPSYTFNEQDMKDLGFSDTQIAKKQVQFQLAEEIYPDIIGAKTSSYIENKTTIQTLNKEYNLLAKKENKTADDRIQLGIMKAKIDGIAGIYQAQTTAIAEGNPNLLLDMAGIEYDTSTPEGLTAYHTTIMNKFGLGPNDMKVAPQDQLDTDRTTFESGDFNAIYGEGGLKDKYGKYFEKFITDAKLTNTGQQTVAITSNINPNYSNQMFNAIQDMETNIAKAKKIDSEFSGSEGALETFTIAFEEEFKEFYMGNSDMSEDIVTSAQAMFIQTYLRTGNTEKALNSVKQNYNQIFHKFEHKGMKLMLPYNVKPETISNNIDEFIANPQKYGIHTGSLFDITDFKKDIEDNTFDNYNLAYDGGQIKIINPENAMGYTTIFKRLPSATGELTYTNNIDLLENNDNTESNETVDVVDSWEYDTTVAVNDQDNEANETTTFANKVDNTIQTKLTDFESKELAYNEQQTELENKIGTSLYEQYKQFDKNQDGNIMGEELNEVRNYIEENTLEEPEPYSLDKQREDLVMAYSELESKPIDTYAGTITSDGAQQDTLQAISVYVKDGNMNESIIQMLIEMEAFEGLENDEIATEVMLNWKDNMNRTTNTNPPTRMTPIQALYDYVRDLEQDMLPSADETAMDAQVQVLMMMSGMTEQEAIDYINEGN
tara:strand:+ start:5359 stop:8340 length:2982 start_codon:yes stop_codon:yes gene_type:complete